MSAVLRIEERGLKQTKTWQGNLGRCQTISRSQVAFSKGEKLANGFEGTEFQAQLIH